MRASHASAGSLVLLVCLASAGCNGLESQDAGRSAPKPSNTEATARTGAAARPNAISGSDAIPTDQRGPVLKAHFRGLGLMEREDYAGAAAAFQEAHERAPDWVPGMVNLAIATVHFSTIDEPEPKYDKALGLLTRAIARDPNNLTAHYCRGLILELQNQRADAHQEFLVVTRGDPGDGHAWLQVGQTLGNPLRSGQRTTPEQARELITIYSKALEANPYLLSALYKLAFAYGLAGDRDKQVETLERWRLLDPSSTPGGTGEISSPYYGEEGRYARLIDPFPPSTNAQVAGPPPKFDAPAAIKMTLRPSERWAKAADFTGPLAVIGRARSRFGAAIAIFDADGDGRLDLFLAAAVTGPHGVRDALLRNRGDGAFEDVTLSSGLANDRASLGVAAGDFDADGRVDLYLTGPGGNRLYRNRGPEGFGDVTAAARVGGPPAVSLTARWLDLDQDGDLDLYVVNHTRLENADRAFTDQPPPGIANVAYRNDGRPAPVDGLPLIDVAPVGVTSDRRREAHHISAGLSMAFTAWPDPGALGGGGVPHTGLAILDLDDDRDFDLVLSADGVVPSVVLNDRLGHFRAINLGGMDRFTIDSGLLTADLDQDGRTDLVRLDSSGRVVATRVRSAPANQSVRLELEPWPCDARGWRSAIACDLDLDSRPDLLGLSAAGSPGGTSWARNDGRGLAAAHLPIGPDRAPPRMASGMALADLIGDPLPDLLLVEDNDGPRLARNLGNGRHWLSLTLAGRWEVWGHLRSNPHGTGARVQLEGPGLHSLLDTVSSESGPAQSVVPKVVGLDTHGTAPLVRILWPDGVRQTEMNVPADKPLVLEERTHRVSTCPILFAWDGDRYRCVSDLLAGGGLGYLMAPGVYVDPDRDESVVIPDDLLRPVDGAYKISIAEPMDEVAYLDHLVLDVIDRPPGVRTTADERFATGVARPTGELIAWRTVIETQKATDMTGRDLTDVLRTWDRQTADGFGRLAGWNGYTEEHGIVLDFGDRLSRFGPGDRLVLCLAGWVEYPFSQTNYAAATAGVPLNFPVLERRKDDGSWEVIEAHPGCPAGLPRLTTLELTGRLNGPRCELRLRTNLECYWDQAFIALQEPKTVVRVNSLPVTRAVLGYRGYLREASPDGRLPKLYDHEAVVPVPLARVTGRLTRYGDVAGLLQGDDDRLCLVGPGDEVRVEFDARGIPALPVGWTRGYVLRATGYCKDADLFTATGDCVGPLPWRGMGSYPYGTSGRRPSDPDYDAYLAEYQIRPAAKSR